MHILIRDLELPPPVFLVSMKGISILPMFQPRTWTWTFLFSFPLIHIQLGKKLYLLYSKIYPESAISCDPPCHHPIQSTITPHLGNRSSFQHGLPDATFLSSGHSQRSNQEHPFEAEIGTRHPSAPHLPKTPQLTEGEAKSYPTVTPEALCSHPPPTLLQPSWPA